MGFSGRKKYPVDGWNSSRLITDKTSSTESWMDASKWEFIRENWGLVELVAHRWRKRVGAQQEWDELMSGALELAVKCLRSYDPEKSAFSTYYLRAAQDPFRYMIFKTQAVHKYGRVDSLNESRHHEGREEQVQDMLICMTQVEDDALSAVMAESLREAIERLPPRLRRHAYDTLEGNVSWKNLAHTVEIRREMLEALREELMNE